MEKVLKDIKYGTHERHLIDIYFPEKPVSNSGFILFIHGGGWQSCDKSAHTPDTEYWSKKGYICGTMNYRYVSDKISVFDELDDVTAALEKAKEICAGYGFYINKLLLSGGSAGAHLSLMYAYTKSDISPVKPVAVVAFCPPTDCSKPDFLMGVSGEFEDWKYQILSKCCGKKVNKKNLMSKKSQAALKNMSPVTYLNKACVPTAVCHGKNDELVPFSQTLDFIAKLNELNIKNDLLIYENSGHALDKDPDAVLQSKELTESYLKKYFDFI